MTRRARPLLRLVLTLSACAMIMAGPAAAPLPAREPNLSRYLDVDASGLAADADNTSGSFMVKFDQELETPDAAINFHLADSSGNNLGELGQVAITPGTDTFYSRRLDFTSPDYRDRLVVAEIQSSGQTIYSLQDAIDISRYQESDPIIASVSISETRADPLDIYNNLPNTHDLDIFPITAGNTYSHYIIDIDRMMGAGLSEDWDASPYGQAPPGDGGRIPLIMVHGWQGGKNTRGSAQLSLWDTAPVHTWSSFISFYLTSEELQAKYHLYAFRWPAYKHLTYSGEQFAGLLTEAREADPDSALGKTDLASGLRDANQGVVVMTHSTGGLIARAAAETHGAFASGGNETALLRQAVLLASPNHGTPLAVNVVPNSLLMDTASQATADLCWDGFDGANSFFSPFMVSNYLSNRHFSRWSSEVQNVEAFDKYYMGLLSDYGESDKVYNPWLAWFNARFENEKLAGYQDKYLLYSGWTDANLFSPINYVNNGPAEGFSADDLWSLGYRSDSVLPVSSNLMGLSVDDPLYKPAANPTAGTIRPDW